MSLPVQPQSRPHPVLPLAASLLLGALPAQAAPPAEPRPAAPAAPSAGWLNDTLRARDPALARWNLGALYSTRYEVHRNGGFTGPGSTADFRTDVDNDNSYLLQKVIVRAGYSGDLLEVFAQGRHSSVTGDDRSSSGNGSVAAGPIGGGSSPEADGPFELHQAWLAVGQPANGPATLRLGRQELLFGEQRLVGPLAWNNVQRQWDAARLTWRQTSWVADAWTSMLVMPRDHRFNEPNPDEIFSGLRVSAPAVPGFSSEFLFLARNVGRDANRGDRALVPAPFRPPEAQDLYTVGFHLKNAGAAWRGFDLSAQAYGQFGSFADFREAGGNGPRREHRAFAGILGGGHTWSEAPGLPRVGLEYAFASGDTDPGDSRHTTFVHLYPTAHLHQGYADFASLQNIHNVRLRTSVQPHPRLRLALDGHLLWLASTHDNFYNVGGLPRGGQSVQAAADQGTAYGIHPGAGSYVGSEVDLVATFQLGRLASLEAAYCHFFRGDYIRDSLARVGSQDADFVYVQLQANF